MLGLCLHDGLKIIGKEVVVANRSIILVLARRDRLKL